MMIRLLAIKIISVIALILVSGCATQQYHDLYQGDAATGVILQSKETILIESINGRDANTGFIGQLHRYELPPGEITIIVTYADLFDESADDFEKVKSGPIKISFTAHAGKQYQLSHEPVKGLDAASKFAKKPELHILDRETGKAIPISVEYSVPRSLLPAFRFESEDPQVFASDMKPAAVTQEKGSSELSPLRMLKFSWQQASQKDREAFMQWIKQ